MATLLRLTVGAVLLALTAASTVHDALSAYDLPRGLLPDSVKTYSVTGDGFFSIELTAPCYVQFSDLVYYELHIFGKLDYSSISDISGIKVKKLLVWVPITGIVANPNEETEEFEVGFISESLPAKQFVEIPKCRAKASCRRAAGVIQEVVVPVAEIYKTLTRSLKSSEGEESSSPCKLSKSIDKKPSRAKRSLNKRTK